MESMLTLQRSAPPTGSVFLELGQAISFVLSILSLCALLDSAFFAPATRWEDRLLASFARIGLAASICFVSGLLFHISEPRVPLTQTLPVRIFICALFGFALLFVLAWSLDVYYVPFLWRNQPN
jgi:hypothetical protein